MYVNCSGSQAGGRGSIDLGLWAPNTIYFPKHNLKTTGIRRPCPHCSENAAGNPDSVSVKVGVNLRDVQFQR